MEEAIPRQDEEAAELRRRVASIHATNVVLRDIIEHQSRTIEKLHARLGEAGIYPELED